ncbi:MULTISPECIES: AraC family transcriptional regulator [Paenibacillus]|uniref:AraC family transcriptional regulator n=1 Tax=Paenibacillus TaxID=44249 RepID=UPI000365AD3D|nr:MULTISPECIES: AraC family transcriptional regulator [Paenibacillus]
MASDIIFQAERESLERFMLSTSSFIQTGGLWITQAGRYSLEPGCRRLFATNPTCFWIANRQGGMIIKNGHNYVLGTNNIWCMSSMATIEYINNTDEPLETYFVGFTGPQADLLIQESNMQDGYSELSTELFDQMIDYYNLILNTNQRSDTFSAELRRLEVLFGMFAMLSANQAARIDYTPTKEPVPWMEQAIEYIHAYFDKGLTVTQVANYVGIHRTHFSKQFHEKYRTPPAEYIRSLKMEKARRLLSDTNDSLAEIAFAVGYPDVFSFSKAFKKHSGFTPKRYRLHKF